MVSFPQLRFMIALAGVELYLMSSLTLLLLIGKSVVELWEYFIKVSFLRLQN